MRILKRRQCPTQRVTQEMIESARRFHKMSNLRAIFELTGSIENYRGFNNSYNFTRYYIDGIEFFVCYDGMGAKAIRMMMDSKNIYSYSPIFKLINFFSIFADSYEAESLLFKLIDSANDLISKKSFAKKYGAAVKGGTIICFR